MSRLTYKSESGMIWFVDEEGKRLEPCEMSPHHSRLAIEKLAHYEDLEEKGHIERVANMLGVELYEEFKIKPTTKGELLGVKCDERTFRFDTELVYEGYNDGWSKWYGFGCDKILYDLLLGKAEVVKLAELKGGE